MNERKKVREQIRGHRITFSRGSACKLDDFASEITELAKRYPDAEIELEESEYSADLHLYTYRYETDKEYELRLLEEKNRREAIPVIRQRQIAYLRQELAILEAQEKSDDM